MTLMGLLSWRHSLDSLWMTGWQSSSVLPEAARTNVFGELESGWQNLCQINLVSVSVGPFSTQRRYLYDIEDLRHDERTSRPSLHLQLGDSQTLDAQLLTIHTTPRWTLFVYIFQTEGRLFIQEFTVKTARRHGPRKKGGSHIEKKPTCFFFARRSKEPNVVEAVKMKGRQTCGDFGSELMNQRLLWSTKSFIKDVWKQANMKSGSKM